MKEWIVDHITAKSYVQDGLIAMWDGIENAGQGMHDDNATIWKDLVGSADLVAKNTPTINANSVSFDGNSCFYKYGLSISGIPTVEICGCRSVQQPQNKSEHELLRLNADRGYKINCITLNGSYSNNYVRVGIFGIGAFSQVEMNVAKTCTWITSSSPQQQYWNGKYVSSWVQNRPLTNVSSVIVGAEGTGLSRACICTIHCVRLYSRLLSASEIAANYAIDKVRFGIA